MISISKSCDPSSFESAISDAWEQSNAFCADSSSSKKPFTISMPPPNATGQLHVGHAVMLALEDILCRWHRMMGDEVLFLPGTDHAAIATENVVLKQIKEKEGIEDPRATLGREKVLEHIREYVKQSQGTIRKQIRAMGTSCDWSRERFTMDDSLNRCVNSVFSKMFDDGLIYRGYRIVNWDPTLQTTISDDEIEYQDTPSTLYYIQYGPFVIATSRPETKLGDTGIAVHPDDERYKDYIGKTLEVCWPKGQKIAVKVIADAHVDQDFGSGVIGLTPAHSQVDFQMSCDHGLEVLQVIGEDGCMMDNTGSYQGLSVKECRKSFVADLEAAGLMCKKEDYIQPLSICYRSKRPVEPLPKEQWFIDVNKSCVSWQGKTQSLKEILIDVVKSGQINIVPERFNGSYFHWIENLRDWCISRQIWWGHRIPVWYCQGDDCRDNEGETQGETVASATKPEGNWIQDPDTLDTWFSSALWTWSTLIDPEIAQNQELSFEELLAQSPDFQKFHPTQVMETGYDILFFWVARMILMTTYMVGEVPFDTVYLHGLVRTKDGKKMSKSHPETCLDPLESIETYGTDALRLGLIMGTGSGMDFRVYPEKLETCRRFVNKLWNAGRYILMTLSESMPLTAPKQVESETSQWILHRLNQLVEGSQDSLEKYRLSEAVEQIRAFLWGEFCDWYLEMDKTPERTQEQDHVLTYTYTTLLRLLHPYMPFVTEALWKNFDDSNLLALSEWPQAQPDHVFESSFQNISLVQETVSHIRALREKANIGLNQKIKASVTTLKHADLLECHHAVILRLARLSEFEIIKEESNLKQEKLSVYFQDALLTIDAPEVDWTAQLKSLKKKLNKESKFLKQTQGKFNNPRFLEKAPASLIAELKEKVLATEKVVSALEHQIQELEK